MRLMKSHHCTPLHHVLVVGMSVAIGHTHAEGGAVMDMLIVIELGEMEPKDGFI